MTYRTPQSAQSLPISHEVYSAPGPPSSHWLSFVKSMSSVCATGRVQSSKHLTSEGVAGGGGSGGGRTGGGGRGGCAGGGGGGNAGENGAGAIGGGLGKLGMHAQASCPKFSPSSDSLKRRPDVGDPSTFNCACCSSKKLLPLPSERKFVQARKLSGRESPSPHCVYATLKHGAG